MECALEKLALWDCVLRRFGFWGSVLFLGVQVWAGGIDDSFERAETKGSKCLRAG